MSTDKKTPLHQFLGDHICLIVESSQAFSSSIQSILYGMGVPRGNVLIAGRYEDARRLIEEKKPRIVISEYEVEKKMGLTLIEQQQAQHSESERISMIITKNSADSVVAEAAEEQVDAFLLKPFSTDTFQKKIEEVLGRKLNPTPYAAKMSSGKALLQNKDYTKASEEFLAAKKLDPQPTLACYYAGQAFLGLGETKRALAEFREGRGYKPLHYNCLIGEFELHIIQKNFGEAMELAGPIKENFPLTPRRLGQIILATVFTQHFSELANLYELFTNLESRPPQLVTVTSMALLTAGKYYLAEKDVSRAIDLFDKGFLSAAKDLGYLEKVIAELLKANAAEEAKAFLNRAPGHILGTPEHSRLAFKIDAATLHGDALIERGRKLVLDGHGTPEIFESMVRLTAEAGKATLAESMIARAVKTNPELRVHLYKILEEKLNKPAS